MAGHRRRVGTGPGIPMGHQQLGLSLLSDPHAGSAGVGGAAAAWPACGPAGAAGGIGPWSGGPQLSGIPPISTPNPQCKMLINRYDCGLIMHDWNFESFSNSLELALRLYETTKYEKMVKNCIKATKEELNWNAQMTKLKKFLKSVLRSFLVAIFYSLYKVWTASPFGISRFPIKM